MKKKWISPKLSNLNGAINSGISAGLLELQVTIVQNLDTMEPNLGPCNQYLSATVDLNGLLNLTLTVPGITSAFACS